MTTYEVALRKPFNINPSILRDTKSLLYGLLNGTTFNEDTTISEFGGDRYDYKRISVFQSSKIQSGCEDLGVDNLALEVMPDYIHFFVDAKIIHTPYKMVKQLRGNTNIQLRRCFPDLKYLVYKQHYGKGYGYLWAIGYYCRSAGHVSQEAVKRYILEQQGKDVFEYSVFGSHNQKIGDFTLTKLGCF